MCNKLGSSRVSPLSRSIRSLPFGRVPQHRSQGHGEGRSLVVSNGKSIESGSSIDSEGEDSQSGCDGSDTSDEDPAVEPSDSDCPVEGSVKWLADFRDVDNRSEPRRSGRLRSLSSSELSASEEPSQLLLRRSPRLRGRYDNRALGPSIGTKH